MSDKLRNRIVGVLGRSPVIDGHNDLLICLRGKVRYDFDKADISQNRSDMGLHTDIPRLRTGGVGGQFWSVFVPGSMAGHTAVTATLEQIDAAKAMIARYDDLAFASTADEIEKAFDNGQIASLLGAEGGHSIDCSLGTLRMLYELGVRYMTLTHTSNTPWADSGTDEPNVGGLSPFGREVVAEMNRIGMMVDLSHVAPTTMRTALEVSEAPAFFSHSNALSLCSHPRNVPDDVLRMVGQSHGIVMATFVPGFLTEEGREWMDAAEAFEDECEAEHAHEGADVAYRKVRECRAEWLADNPCPKTSTKDVADHIEYIRDIAGVDCVGIGGDLDGIGNTPIDIPDVTAYPTLLEELASRKWSDADLAKLASENVIRVLRDTETVSERLSKRAGPSMKTFAELDGE